MLALLLVALTQDTSPPFVRSFGHPGALVITGAEEIGAEAVRQAVLNDADYFEASLPMQRLPDYVGWLESVVAFAYLNAGFVEVQVTPRVDDAAGEIELAVVEGPRYRAAEVDVRGAIHLDEDWIREVLRAGTVERGAAAAGRAAEPTPPPFWVPGEPAPVSPIDRERFEQLVDAAVRAAGFLDAETRVGWEPGQDATVRPVLTVAREGPRAVVEDVRFEGAQLETADELRAWAAVADEAPASLPLRWAVEDRLRATGRFLEVQTRYEARPDREGRVVLAARLVPNPLAPPVAEHPAEDLALLVAGVERLARQSLEPDAGPIGMTLELDVGPPALASLHAKLAELGLGLEEDQPASYRVRVALVQRAASLELVRAIGDDETAPLLRLWIDAQRGRIDCPPLGIEREFGPARAVVLAILQGAVKPVIDDPERPVHLNLSGAIQSGAREGGAPVRIALDVHPSLPLHLLSRWTVDRRPDEESLRLTFESDAADARIVARRDGTRLVAEVDLHVDGVSGAFTLGDLDALEAPAWSRAKSARADADPDPVVEARWQAAALQLLRTVLAARGADGPRAGVALLGVTGLQAFLSPSSPSSERDAEPDPERAHGFHVPRRPPAAGEAAPMRRFGERLATLAIEGRAPGSWCDHLLRCVPLLTMPSSQNELSAGGTLLGQIAQDPARGPVGAWLAAECCAALGRPQWARSMAEVGRQDLSAARFVADCDALLGAPDDEARGAGARRIVGAWSRLLGQALDERDGGLDDGGFDDAERAALRAVFGDAAPEDERAIWEAGLTALWDELLRGYVARRLDALARS